MAALRSALPDCRIGSVALDVQETARERDLLRKELDEAKTLISATGMKCASHGPTETRADPLFSAESCRDGSRCVKTALVVSPVSPLFVQLPLRVRATSPPSAHTLRVLTLTGENQTALKALEADVLQQTERLQARPLLSGSLERCTWTLRHVRTRLCRRRRRIEECELRDDL